MKKIFVFVLTFIFCLGLFLPFSAVQETQMQVIENFKKGLYIGDWVPNTSTEEQVKMLAECGIQYTFIWYFSYNNPQKVQELKWCEKYGVKVILKDIDIEIYGKGIDEISSQSAQDIYEIIKPSIGNPTVIGYNIFDEPSERDYPVLGEYLEKFRSVSQGMIPFVNLYPDRYGSYIDRVFTTLGQDYVSVDIYPFYGDTTLTHYYYNLKQVGDSAREHGGDFWLFIQSMQWDAQRLPDIYDMRFQAYSGMAFGVTKLMHFCYANALKNSFAAVTDGVKTEQYDVLQQFNSEMQFLAPILENYKNLGAFYTQGTGKSPDYMDRLDPYSAYRDFRSVCTVESDLPLLLGAFEDKASQEKAFMVVNASDCAKELEADVTFTLRYSNAPATVTMEGRTFEVLPDENGVYSLHLGAGGGAFVQLQERERTSAEAQLDELYARCNDGIRQYAKILSAETYDALSVEALGQFVEKYFDRLNSEDMSCQDLNTAAEELDGALKQIKTVRQASQELLTQFEQTDSSVFEAGGYKKLSVYAQRLQDAFAEGDEADLVAAQGLLRMLRNAFDSLVFTGLSGDLTRDGSVTLADVIRAAKHVLNGGADYTQMRIGDMDGDFELGLNDVISISKIVLNAEI